MTHPLTVTNRETLTDEQFDVLGQFLGQVRQTGGAGPLPPMNLEMLDGFFCALICAPVLVAPSEYLSEIWGDYAFDSDEQASEMLGLLFEHWNNIAATMLRTLTEDEVYLPFLYDATDSLEAGRDWANGFLRGTMLSGHQWADLVDADETDALLLPILMLAHEDSPDPDMRTPVIPPDKREEILTMMIASATRAYRYFEPMRREGRSRLPPVPRRVGLKVGRNEPCPCGSGKKYKACCLNGAPTVH